MNQFHHQICDTETQSHLNLSEFNVSATHPTFVATIDDFCSVLVGTLSALESAIRQFHPPLLTHINEALLPFKEQFAAVYSVFKELSTPSQRAEFLIKQLNTAADLTQQALELFASPPESQRLVLQILRAMRRYSRAQEALFPLRSFLGLVNRFFLESNELNPEDWIEVQPADDTDIGLMTINRADEDEDPYWFYVPDRYSGKTDLPLVIALHGGSGTGRDFIWSWMREARNRNFMLLAPTSIGRTWSFQNEDDAAKMMAAVRYISENWHLDSSRILLTGFSDGAIYVLTSGLKKESPYTALAPISGVLHPVNLDYAVDRRIYLVHGRLDWMFQVDYAYRSHAILQAAGADIIFHEIEDLSHTYPREENASILAWFSPSLKS